MAEKYGATPDALYTLFAAPPEKDLEWSEESIEGSWRFVNKVYRMVERHAAGLRGVSSTTTRLKPETPKEKTPKEKTLLRVAHQTLRRVGQDFETRWHLNSAIALIMTFAGTTSGC